MQEGDEVAARAGAGRLVDQADPGRFQRGQRAAQIVDLEADVVEAGPAFREEARQRGVARGGANFQGGSVVGRAACVQKRDVGLLPRDVLARANRQAEQRGQIAGRGVAVGDGDGDVIDSLDLDHGRKI